MRTWLIGIVGLVFGLGVNALGQDGNDLEALKKLFEEKLGEAEKALLGARVKLNLQYTERLDAIRAEQIDAGNLDGVLAVDSEKKLLKTIYEEHLAGVNENSTYTINRLLSNFGKAISVAISSYLKPCTCIKKGIRRLVSSASIWA